MFTSAFPILSTPDVTRALGFYRDLLDGKVEYQFPPEGEPGYVGLALGSSHLDALASAPRQRQAPKVSASRCGCTPTTATPPSNASVLLVCR